MLGCAIAEGIFGKQNFLLSVKSQARRLLACKNESSGLLLMRNKLPELNYSRRNYETIVHGRSGRSGRNETCAAQRISVYNRRALFFQTRPFSQTKPYDLDTNVKKDVILYKYENPKYFKRLNIFGFGQFLFWSYLAHFVFTELKDVPVTDTKADDLPWWRRINFGEKTHRTVLTTCTFLIGYTMFALAWAHTLKSVRYLILRKGGNDVTFVTYTPFGENRMRTIPLDKMTSKQSREAAKVQLPIKVKGDWMHYLLDMRGEFRHPRLYDFTAGLKRPI